MTSRSKICENAWLFGGQNSRKVQCGHPLSFASFWHVAHRYMLHVCDIKKALACSRCLSGAPLTKLRRNVSRGDKTENPQTMRHKPEELQSGREESQQTWFKFWLKVKWRVERLWWQSRGSAVINCYRSAAQGWDGTESLGVWRGLIKT